MLFKKANDPPQALKPPIKRSVNLWCIKIQPACWPPRCGILQLNCPRNKQRRSGRGDAPAAIARWRAARLRSASALKLSSVTKHLHPALHTPHGSVGGVFLIYNSIPPFDAPGSALFTTPL